MASFSKIIKHIPISCVKLIEVRCKNAFVRSRLPGADWVVNQYVGCGFGCPYCYAKFMCRFRSHGVWGTWVEAKINAHELVMKKVPGEVLMSSVSDPYQPVETKMQLTRRVLENMDKSNRLTILTKSPLVLRDVDVLKEFNHVEVGLTINGFSGADRIFEPRTPSHRSRVAALKRLHEEGIKNYAFISPIIPGVVDVERLVSETQDFVDYYWMEMLNIRAAGAYFRRLVKDRHPEALELFVGDKLGSFVKEVRKSIYGVRVRGIVYH